MEEELEKKIQEEVEKALENLTIKFEPGFLQTELVLKFGEKELARTKMPIF